jgi:hypothetical protein
MFASPLQKTGSKGLRPAPPRWIEAELHRVNAKLLATYSDPRWPDSHCIQHWEASHYDEQLGHVIPAPLLITLTRHPGDPSIIMVSVYRHAGREGDLEDLRAYVAPGNYLPPGAS